MKYIFNLLIVSVIVGCSTYPPDVRSTLLFAGDNRAELEKVLKHYSQHEADSLKYKAACFLIGNMRYHYTQNDEQLDRFRRYILDTVPTQQTYTNFQQKYGKLNSRYDITFDAQVITADYLIRNIDFSFRLWEGTPWGNHYSFDVFCEELLPYRIGNEPIEDWKEVYYNRYQAMLDTATIDRSSPLAAWRMLFDYLHSISGEYLLEWVFAYDWTTPNLGALTLLDLRYGNCQELTDMLTYAMRSVGIAGGIDMMVQHPDNYDRQHWWNYMRDTSGLCTAFDFYYDMDEPAEKMTCIHKCGVAYRKCFAIQKESMLWKYHSKNVYIPSQLSELHIKNISEQYFNENPVILPVGNEYRNGDILYVSVFNNSEWIPVTYEEVKGGKVEFNYLEPNVLYQLTHFSAEGIYKPLSDPFILYEDGSVFFARPDQQKQDMRLNRKFRMPWWWYEKAENVIGGKFQFAHKPDFSDAVTVHTVTDAAMRYIDIDVNITQSYQYVRYLSAPGGYNMMAEMQFYSPDTPTAPGISRKEVQLQGKVIGTDGSFQDMPDKTKYSAFDGDALTYYFAQEASDAWAGLEFDKPQRISRIRYWFRYDDNTIREGDHYELLYWDENDWISAGRQTATDTLLYFNQIPSGTLYWLRNHTRGREERPFTYEDGKQVWW